MKLLLAICIFIGLASLVSAQARYVVAPGDTLYTIAQKYYGDVTPWKTIYTDNQKTIGKNPLEIKPGMVLSIRVPFSYKIQSGDTLIEIARKFYGDESKWKRLYYANLNAIGSNPDLIQVGTSLQLSLPPTIRYTVQSGDYLKKIAKDFYGDESKWQQIYNLNKAVIGNNPNLIQIGMVLTLNF